MSGEPRRLGANLSVRLSAEYLAAIDELATTEGRTRTEMLRVLLSDGLLVHRKRIASDGSSAEILLPAPWAGQSQDAREVSGPSPGTRP